MSYTQKVIFISLGTLIAFTLICAIPGIFSYHTTTDFLEFGLIALFVSIAETFLLILIGIGILIVKPGGGSVTVSNPKELLDASEEREVPLPYNRRAGAFFAAAGVVFLVGGSVCIGGLMTQ